MQTSVDLGPHNDKAHSEIPAVTMVMVVVVGMVVVMAMAMAVVMASMMAVAMAAVMAVAIAAVMAVAQSFSCCCQDRENDSCQSDKGKWRDKNHHFARYLCIPIHFCQNQAFWTPFVWCSLRKTLQKT